MNEKTTGKSTYPNKADTFQHANGKGDSGQQKDKD